MPRLGDDCATACVLGVCPFDPALHANRTAPRPRPVRRLGIDRWYSGPCPTDERLRATDRGSTEGQSGWRVHSPPNCPAARIEPKGGRGLTDARRGATPCRWPEGTPLGSPSGVAIGCPATEQPAAHSWLVDRSGRDPALRSPHCIAPGNHSRV